MIVTGASTRLGKAIAKAKAELEVYGTKILTYTMDVSNYEAFEGLVDRTSKELGSIDI